jgi:hypothetical protein
VEAALMTTIMGILVVTRNAPTSWWGYAAVLGVTTLADLIILWPSLNRR